MILFALSIGFQAVIAFLIGTVVFDFYHYAMHKCMRSSKPWLKKLGLRHGIHHRFYPANLIINPKWTQKNLKYHVLIEQCIQFLGTLGSGLVLAKPAVFLALSVQVVLFIGVVRCRGADWHHQSKHQLRSYRDYILVDANYHALHHIYPNNFYSGYIKIFDYLFGTGAQLAGRRITMTGSSGALGSQMKKLLEAEGAIVTSCKFGVDYTYHAYDKLIPLLIDTDILFLCHGSKYENAKEANCDSFISLIELAKSVRQPGLIPLEVWGVGSEIECHPYFGIKKLRPYAESKRAFAKNARLYYHAKDIHYRHLVHSAFTSPMGPGLMSAGFAARATLFFIKRGWKYIPVSYTGFAFLNYFRFLLSRQIIKADSTN